MQVGATTCFHILTKPLLIWQVPIMQVKRHTFCEPAASIVKRLKPELISERLGCSLTTVYRWMWPHSDGGREGLIPRRHHDALLSLANDIDVPLRRDEFFALPGISRGLVRRRPVRPIKIARGAPRSSSLLSAQPAQG